MNKNEALARCRMLWARMIREGLNDKHGVLLDIHGPNSCFRFNCPLCEHIKTYHINFVHRGTNLACRECIDWEGRNCDVEGTTYRNWAYNTSQENARLVLATIDRAIKCYDETGDWK